MILFSQFPQNVITSKNISSMKKLEPVEIQSILHFKENLLILNDVKFGIYIINMIFIAHQRNQIIRERTHSPLCIVDENLNKELFENLIRQSKNPNDQSLSREYSKILDESKVKINDEETQIFDRTENDINNDIDKGENDRDKSDNNINNENENNNNNNNNDQYS